ncbi:MAG: glycerophosphodiester phosphodiesterase [Bacteroidales bacterium]|nr:glycerophosphodiester phosphodiesterase [Bacteroidales bacterium]
MKKILTAVVMAAVTAASFVNAGAKAPQKRELGIVAHRGFWNCEEAGYAKNSVAALKCAQDAGFWGSEFDVNITSDGVLLVFHDGKIDGKVIAEYPYSEFQDITIRNGERIPTLQQYLEQGLKSKKTMLVCELKSQPTARKEDELLDKVVAQLKSYGLLTPRRVMFISFSRHICDRIAREMPKFTNQYLSNDYSPAQLAETGINGIDFHYPWFTEHPEWYPEARHGGMSVNCWTVDKEPDMRNMIELGVDYITTDCPDVLRRLVGELEVIELRK